MWDIKWNLQKKNHVLLKCGGSKSGKLRSYATTQQRHALWSCLAVGLPGIQTKLQKAFTSPIAGRQQERNWTRHDDNDSDGAPSPPVFKNLYRTRLQPRWGGAANCQRHPLAPASPLLYYRLLSSFNWFAVLQYILVGVVVGIGIKRTHLFS